MKKTHFRIGDIVTTKFTKTAPKRDYYVFAVRGKQVGLTDGFLSFYRHARAIITS